uniref:Ground-like domain-containing protein n=1 Tax=Parastrongyloides trichosuri TaxID=131310 RepID=A0A0N4ZI59_PARTI
MGPRPCNNMYPPPIYPPPVPPSPMGYIPGGVGPGNCNTCNSLPQPYQNIYPPPYAALPRPVPVQVITQPHTQQTPAQVPIYKSIYSGSYQQVPTNLLSSALSPTNACKDCFEKLNLLKYMRKLSIPEGDPINSPNIIISKEPVRSTAYSVQESSDNKESPFLSQKQGLIEQDKYETVSFNKDNEKTECITSNMTYYNPPLATSSYPINECCVGCDEECEYKSMIQNNVEMKKHNKTRRSLIENNDKCTNEKLRTILTNYIGPDAKSSAKIIQKNADEVMLEAHNVICSNEVFYYITRSSSFCQLSIGNVHCYIFGTNP